MSGVIVSSEGVKSKNSVVDLFAVSLQAPTH